MSPFANCTCTLMYWKETSPELNPSKSTTLLMSICPIRSRCCFVTSRISLLNLHPVWLIDLGSIRDRPTHLCTGRVSRNSLHLNIIAPTLILSTKNRILKLFPKPTFCWFLTRKIRPSVTCLPSLTHVWRTFWSQKSCWETLTTSTNVISTFTRCWHKVRSGRSCDSALSKISINPILECLV